MQLAVQQVWRGTEILYFQQVPWLCSLLLVHRLCSEMQSPGAVFPASADHQAHLGSCMFCFCQKTFR